MGINLWFEQREIKVREGERGGGRLWVEERRLRGRMTPRERAISSVGVKRRRRHLARLAAYRSPPPSLPRPSVLFPCPVHLDVKHDGATPPPPPPPAAAPPPAPQ